MADWSQPLITTQYDVFLAECKTRDVDAITLCLNNPTNPPVGAVKMVRLGAGAVKLQEWNGTIFNDVVLAIASGGTGANNATGARTALGIGTMGLQNSNSVAITGGTISGLTQLHLSTSITWTADNTWDIGDYTNRIRRGYFRSALVVPVGADKYAVG